MALPSIISCEKYSFPEKGFYFGHFLRHIAKSSSFCLLPKAAGVEKSKIDTSKQIISVNIQTFLSQKCYDSGTCMIMLLPDNTYSSMRKIFCDTK